MNPTDKDKLLQLTSEHGEQLEQIYTGHTFVTYLNCRIFFNWHEDHQQWFFFANRTGEDATRDYACLGVEWFDQWDSWSQGIAWGKQLIDRKVRHQE